MSTPLMAQYGELKARAGDALLLFRMGDFYELFGEDAIEASRILEITLTTRDRGKANPTPMAGVPWHSAQAYIQKLLRAGKKVAIGEQVEDPATVKSGQIVRREIVRTFTPGINFDQDAAEACFIAAIAETPATGSDGGFVLACLDAATGETLVSEPLDADALASELAAFPIRHLVRIADSRLPQPVTLALETLSRAGALVEALPGNYLSRERAAEILRKHYEVQNLSPFISTDAGILALGTIVTYVTRSQQRERLSHLWLPSPLRKPRSLVLGPRTPQHLDLLHAEAGAPDLFRLLNKTRSAPGARELKRWILAPLTDTAEIAERQNAIRELSGPGLQKISDALSEVYDLERISGRVQTRLANPRDTLALGRTLGVLPRLADLLVLRDASSPLLRELRARLRELAARLSPLAERITASQRDEAPLSAREGGIFKRGTHAELDRLLSLSEDGQRWLVELEAREREVTGIPSLKVRYNRVFGYYIEITQAHLKNAPAHYQRKQTTVGGERFFTEELKRFEDDFVNASAKQKALEQSLFEDLISAIDAEAPAVTQAARLLARADVLAALAHLAREPGWMFPEVRPEKGSLLEITQGRHPLVDAGTGNFIPNDLSLSKGRSVLVITGPNMGGKSTVMRQTALIVILGQMGAPVPAQSARWDVVSSLFTRIGAHDAIARGQSTFMVEMSELAHILHHADAGSLIILDEIGRGTSTYDGVSVAWATLEWIATQIQARTLFATHYHELTRLTSSLPGVANAHMAVDGGQKLNDPGGFGLRFLYQLRDGPTNESFGIHVARIAGIPRAVVERAWSVLGELESQARGPGAAPGEATPSEQLSFFAAEPKAPAPPDPLSAAALGLLSDLKALEVDRMTPLEALCFLAKAKDGIASRSADASLESGA